MSDLLSQEEIDALLKGDNVEPKAEENLDHSLTEKEKDALGEIGNISMGTAATTLYTLLHHRVTITTPEVTLTTLKEMSMQYPIPFVAIDIQYTQGLEGNNLLILHEDDVKAITDLLMGGDGTNIDGELTELQLSAISEVMNQMVGSAATSLATMLDTEISISPPRAFSIDFANQMPEEIFESTDPVVKINFKMQIEGILDSYIMQLIPIDFAKDMVGALTGEQELEEPAGESLEAESTEPKPQQVSTTHKSAAMAGGPESKTASQTMPDPGPKIEPQAMPKSGAPGISVTQGAYGGGTPAGRENIYDTGAVGVQTVEFQPLDETPVREDGKNIDLIMDVPLQISVELGRSKKKIQEILELNAGSIIELDKMAGEPVDILVNGKAIAKGEVVVIDDNFGVRVTDIINQSGRIAHLE